MSELKKVGQRQSSVDLWLSGLLLLASASFRLSAGPLLIDDAFITFRYSHNGANDVGFVFNLGEKVLGTTTPLWMLLLSAAARFGLDLPTTAYISGALLDSLVPPLLFQIARAARWSRTVGLIAPIAYIAHPLPFSMAVSGMETGAFMALLMASVLVYLRHREYLAVFLAALLTLTRPEGAIFLSAIMLHLIWERRTIPFAPIAIASSILLPWLVYATLHYGSPVPQSVLSKASYPDSLGWSAGEFFGFLYNTASFPLSLIDVRLAYVFGLLVASVPIVILGITQPRLRSFALFHTTLFFALFAMLFVNRLLFYWWLTPLLPGIFLGLAYLSHAISRATDGKVRSIGLVIAPSVLFISLMNGWNTHAVGLLPMSPGRAYPEQRKTAGYEEAAAALAAATEDEAVILTNEVGVLGYRLMPRRIIDALGLVSPGNGFGVRELTALPYGILRSEKPDYFVSYEAYLRETLKGDPLFLDGYALLTAFPGTSTWSLGRVLVFAPTDCTERSGTGSWP